MVLTRRLFYLTLFLSANLCSFQAQGQLNLWGTMKPGPDGVGFKVIWEHDFSRTWQQESDFRGNTILDAPYRPIRISIWYPTESKQNSSRMTFRDYVYLRPVAKGFEQFNRMQEEFEVGGPGKGIRGFFKSEEGYEVLLTTPMHAIRDAAPKRGSFPLIIYSIGQNDYTQENVVMFEFLASHGYVVATVPHLGTSPRRFNLYINDPLSYETQIRDLEFVIQRMRLFPNADATRSVAMGMSQGGVYALLLAMRHPEIDAVIALDSYLSTKTASYEFKYWQAPYFDSGRTRSPILFLHKAGSTNYDVAEEMKFSDRFFVTLDQLTHGDFNSTPMIVAGAPISDVGEWINDDIKVRNQETGAKGHELVCGVVLRFLDRVMKSEKPVKGFTEVLDNSFATEDMDAHYRYVEGLKGPTEEEYAQIIEREGLESAVKIFQKTKERFAKVGPIREKTLNHIGNEFLWAGKSNKAIAIFKLNAVAHPYSSSVYKSLAEGYEQLNEIPLAIKNYEKTLGLDPKDQDSIDALKRLKGNTK